MLFYWFSGICKSTWPPLPLDYIGGNAVRRATPLAHGQLHGLSGALCGDGPSTKSHGAKSTHALKWNAMLIMTVDHSSAQKKLYTA
jgi:hypothetical protein